jgi:hypothetical protein
LVGPYSGKLVLVALLYFSCSSTLAGVRPVPAVTTRARCRCLAVAGHGRAMGRFCRLPVTSWAGLGALPAKPCRSSRRRAAPRCLVDSATVGMETSSASLSPPLRCSALVWHRRPALSGHTLPCASRQALLCSFDCATCSLCQTDRSRPSLTAWA